MPITAVVGAQWGDEGKGRMIDWLAQKADVVIRFQGGDNAGHTVVNEQNKAMLDCIRSCPDNDADERQDCKERCWKEHYVKKSTEDVQESHTHEELMKLSDEKLAELKDEYTKKAADSEGEEKEKHEKELADIEKIMDSRKDDKKEDEENGKSE